ncbi:hypothetical protein BSKO_02033 [Bryopsis sp. KO-2023]|nr:hypothetical protein BSKO_02033 [Bryopsis sp. KO-2023]
MGHPYLLAYNVVLCGGWAYCLYLATMTVAGGGYTADLWEVAEIPLKIFQTAAMLEILHAAVGLVRSPVMLTFMQVFSRVWILWGITNVAPHHTTTGGVELLKAGGFRLELNLITLVAAWSAAEVIRYGFFAFKELGVDLYLMKWLRYTGFIVLYPIGVGSELCLVALALPTIKATQMWSVSMPNAWNFGFSYYIMCWVWSLSYIPCFPQLYFYMLAQRKKVLGPKKTKAS